MPHIIRSMSMPLDDRASMVADALGVLALFVLVIGALHLPLLG